MVDTVDSKETELLNSGPQLVDIINKYGELVKDFESDQYQAKN